jgi:hypothetical protein
MNRTIATALTFAALLVGSALAQLAARDYYNELKTAHAFGRYADEYVCFNDEEAVSFAVLGRASDMIANGMEMPNGTAADQKAFLGFLFVRNYVKGVEGDTNVYQRVGESTRYDIEFNAPIHNGRMVYSMNWVTGRYVLQVFAQDKSKSVPVASTGGKCEFIHPSK